MRNEYAQGTGNKHSGGIMSKYVFFDVDGTLWDDDMIIPESTIYAIRKLRENGHKAIICTGRARASLTSKELFSIGFDGIIAACGTYVELDGKCVFEQLMETDEVKRVLDILSKYKMPVVLEGSTDYWIDAWGFGDDPYVDYLYEDLKEHAHTIHGYDKAMSINKFSTDILPETDYESIKRELSDNYQILEHAGNVVEFVPMNFSKETGVEWLCNYLGIDINDVYAFGDSINDLEMFEVVGHAVAMGNATPVAKECAEYVTDHINEDGLKKALEHYGLI